MTKPGAYEPPTLRELAPAEMPTSVLMRVAQVGLLAFARGNLPNWMAIAAELGARALVIAEITEDHPGNHGHGCGYCDVMEEIGEVRR
jgi:hypothetical protein